MIRFQDVAGEVDSESSRPLERFKDINSVESLSVEKAKNFWDELFGRKDVYSPEEDDETLLSEIFGRYSEEFPIDFEIGQEINECLNNFSYEKWGIMSESEKIETINNFSATLSEKLGLENPPTIEFFSGPRDSCGAYNLGRNSIALNRTLLWDPEDAVDTIAHETWHAYQHQRANMMENKQDYLYKLNFDNYISPFPLGDGKYLYFTDYQDQLVEAEARAFADIFREKVAL